MLVLGAACAVLAGTAEDVFLIPVQFQGLPVLIIVGAVFGFINFLLVAALYPKEVSRKKRSEKTQDPGARRDPGTGLLNKKAFESDIANLRDPLFSLIFMDVDNFKSFKAEFGVQVADSILQKIGKTARERVRSNDLIYKYDGDLFVVTLLNCDKDQAIKIAESIRIQVSELDNSPFPGITLSAAVATFPQDGDLTADLIKVSEELLQSAKKSGKNSTFALARGKIN